MDQEQRIVVIDTKALDHFSCRNMHTQTLLPALCENIGFELHVLDVAKDGMLYHGYPWDVRQGVTRCVANESCACGRQGCVRDAVMSVMSMEAYLACIILDPSCLCIAEFSDRVFALGSTRNECERRQIPHHPVHQWSDVERVMSAMAARNEYTPRRRARLARLDALKTG